MHNLSLNELQQFDDTLRPLTVERQPYYGDWLRSNEVEGPDTDIVFHKDRTTLDMYRELFGRRVFHNILEIGVKAGGGLALWELVFPTASILGVDIAPLTDPRIKVPFEHLDASNPTQLQALTKSYDPFDLIIDDGAHNRETIYPSFDNLWPHVVPGGIYIIEDWAALHPTHRLELHAYLTNKMSPAGTEKNYPSSIKSVTTYKNGIIIQKHVQPSA